MRIENRSRSGPRRGEGINKLVYVAIDVIKSYFKGQWAIIVKFIL